MIISQLTPYEFDQFYGTYLAALKKDAILMDGLVRGKADFIEFMDAIPMDKMLYAYDTGKWTVAEVLGHIIDTERVFQYRALRFSRGDKTPIPGFEQDDYVVESNANTRSMAQFKEAYTAVRDSTICLFKSLTEKQLGYMGTASGLQWSVGGLGFVISGHQEHHRKILERVYLT